MKTQEEIDILKSKALAGDAAAQNDLGCAYSSGDGVAKDLVVATSWFQKSAQQGYVYGQYNLGLQYRYGNGIKKDIYRAVEWLGKMAEWKVEYGTNAKRICGLASNHVGEIYENGYKPTSSEILQGVSLFPSNKEEAFYWYDKGAWLNDDAKFNLARCYELGFGTTKNPRKAYELYDECKTEKAKARQEEILKYFIPLLNTRLGNVPLFRDNPYRVLGVWSNASEREIRANQSKINALQKVGKEASFSSDHVWPCTYADYIAFYTNKVKEADYGFADSQEGTSKLQQTLETWKQLQYVHSEWANKPHRDDQHISEALQKLSSNEQRIKYAFFWFCNATSEDQKNLELLNEHKLAEDAWEDSNSFSALLNRAVCCWLDREDMSAIMKTLEMIHDESFRRDFVSTICSPTFDISETELSHIFLDALFEFSETELSWLTIDEINYHFIYKPFRTDDDASYIESKTLTIIRRPLDDALQFAESQDKSDFPKSLAAYDKVAKIAPYQLLRIKRHLGEDDYRYKLICDNVATKLLEYAIYYNNNNKEQNAASTALRLATIAERCVIDPTLRERCSRNIAIFRKNDQIANTNRIIDLIDDAFATYEKNPHNTGRAENLEQEIKRRLQNLSYWVGSGHDAYKNSSDSCVNRILSILIDICNRDSSYVTLSSANKIVKNLKGYVMTTDTRNRLERNERILSNNLNAASVEHFESTFLNLRKEEYNRKEYRRDPSPYEKAQTKKRRIHKVIASVLTFAAIVALFHTLIRQKNVLTSPWISGTCFLAILVLFAFLVLMWYLESQDDPYDDSLSGVKETASEIAETSFEEPAALLLLPFALIIYLIWLPLRGIAKLATLIK